MSSVAVTGGLIIVLALPASAYGAPSARGRERVATATYQSPAPAVTPVYPYGVMVCNRGGTLGPSRGCMDFVAESNERSLAVRVADASGLPVPGFIAMDDDPANWIPFCGTTTKPIPIRHRGEFQIWVYAYNPVNVTPPCVGTATSGTVTLTFSRAM